MSRTRSQPTSDVDLFGHDLLEDPYPVLRELRDLGGAVHMREHDYYLLSRHADVRAALGDWRTFSSARGTGLEARLNAGSLGGLLSSDPPDHDLLRSVLSEQVGPRGVNRMRGAIEQRAVELVDAVVPLGTFDAVPALAQRFPVEVVADLIGVPQEGRENLIPGADAAFATFGPLTPELEGRLPFLFSFLEWIAQVGTRDRLREGSWGAAVLDAVDEGRIPADKAFPLMRAFLVAGMDTTVNGIGSMLRIFAERPDVWDEIREDPRLGRAAFEETLRLEAPVQAFFRETTCEVEIDGTTIPADSRVCLHFGSANRDERRFADPDRFDLHRGALDHLAFGNGVHGCAGQGLARLEARAIVQALAGRVARFAPAGEPVRHYNPVLRGLQELPVTVEPRPRTEPAPTP
ncbi:cytochrome P450 [Pseudonocardia broussonetiae]|uniref:Cytochrome P450 n=1 Tax=Pseudonocardia broussonetiae TaxID=2736640 RepID=A0A6M6JG18_9PSEU|nr:cytochrome P450 [Pseudonocardia broussonetiae]QJY46085.1 cytochrome P450 [Pseudonocardia broussonetiae]